MCTTASDSCNPTDHTLRKIIHIDMDAFYASVEQRDDMSLRGKPVAVGHEGPRGVVATASYEARRFGVHSAMSTLRARQLCPELLFVPPRFSVYKEISQQVHAIFHRHTDLVEPLSLDEAFLDVSVSKQDIALAVDIARCIKADIKNELNLIASAGVSYNKFLAKIASDFRKPDGLCTIHPNQADDFIAKLPIEKFWGIGPVTARKMHAMGIHTGLELRSMSSSFLTAHFGKAGLAYYDFARGIDLRPVEPFSIRKSVGCERTLEADISQRMAVIIELYHVVQELLVRLSKHPFKGHTLTLKVKFHDFTQITRSATSPLPFTDMAHILPEAKRLMAGVDYAHRPIRLIGLSVSNPNDNVKDNARDDWRQLKLPFSD